MTKGVGRDRGGFSQTECMYMYVYLGLYDLHVHCIYRKNIIFKMHLTGRKRLWVRKNDKNASYLMFHKLYAPVELSLLILIPFLGTNIALILDVISQVFYIVQKVLNQTNRLTWNHIFYNLAFISYQLSYISSMRMLHTDTECQHYYVTVHQIFYICIYLYVDKSIGLYLWLSRTS